MQRHGREQIEQVECTGQENSVPGLEPKQDNIECSKHKECKKIVRELQEQ